MFVGGGGGGGGLMARNCVISVLDNDTSVRKHYKNEHNELPVPIG